MYRKMGKIFLAALLLGACGGEPLEPTATHHGALSEYLQTASPQMVSGSIPGCDKVAISGEIVLMRHPGTVDLVVVVVNGAAACVDTEEAAQRLSVKAALGLATDQPAATPAGTRAGETPEGEEVPTDDPVPVKGDQQEQQGNGSNTKAMGQDGICDDPVPVNGRQHRDLNLTAS